MGPRQVRLVLIGRAGVVAQPSEDPGVGAGPPCWGNGGISVWGKRLVGGSWTLVVCFEKGETGGEKGRTTADLSSSVQPNLRRQVRWRSWAEKAGWSMFQKGLGSALSGRPCPRRRCSTCHFGIGDCPGAARILSFDPEKSSGGEELYRDMTVTKGWAYASACACVIPRDGRGLGAAWRLVYISCTATPVPFEDRTCSEYLQNYRTIREESHLH